MNRSVEEGSSSINMLQDPEITVSVIIPIYNSGKYLSDTLNSIIGQTEKNIEILCVDDGSTDNSVRILQEYASRDNRIKILFQTEESNGAAKARNLGLKNAKGKYLSILDSDDLFEPDLLESCIKRIEESGSEVVLYDGFVYDSETGTDRYVSYLLSKGIIGNRQEFTPDEIKQNLFQVFSNPAWLMFLRRDFVVNKNLQFRPVHFTDDVEFTNLALAEANKIAILDRRLVHYRYNAVGNQSQNRGKHPESVYLTFMYFRESLEKRGLYEKYKNSFVVKAIKYAINYLDSVDNREGFDALYFELKKTYLDKLGAREIEDSLYDPETLKKRNWVYELTPEEYLFNSSRNATVIENQYTFKIPYSLRNSNKTKVILYGAGNIGRSIYTSLNSEKDIEIICWMDKKGERKENWEKGEVISPEVISELSYDVIYVAIKKPNMFNEIKLELVSMGVKEERIIWAFE